ncbi:MAG TPA: hypothetical protein VE046_03635 [Steroidobacteraceae bacterium]|nr:hypothetical protein [Steroidobacteraceae bacterium]
MIEMLYGESAALVAVALLIAAAVIVELGYFAGRRIKERGRDLSAGRVDTVLSSMLGVLALVLAFTFSLSLQRFESRSQAVVDEANAIGTAYLRSYLLPTSIRSDSRELLRDYLDLRVQSTRISTDLNAARRAVLAKAAAAQNVLWSYARQAAEEAPNPVTSGLYIQSLNDLIDAFGRRNATLDRHVPEPVLYVLYSVFLIVAGVVGFGAGVAGHRPFLVSYIMVAVVVLLMFLIVDLDRPRRGLIRVDETSLADLQTAIAAGTYGNGIVPPH